MLASYPTMVAMQGKFDVATKLTTIPAIPKPWDRELLQQHVQALLEVSASDRNRMRDVAGCKYNVVLT